MPATEFHEAADLFPMDEGTIAELAEDIKVNGQRKPIERLAGKIIDGRRRFKACGLIGATPKFVDVETDDPVAYVLSLNLFRRHLTESQRAMVGARARTMIDARAKERMHEGQKSGGRGHKKNSPANLPGSSKQTRDSRDEAAALVNVGGRTIDAATRVLKNGTPELVGAVDAGTIPVSRAAKLTAEPEEVQREAAKNPGRKAARATTKPDPGEGNVPGKKVLGKGIELAEQAITILGRIPKNDALRTRGFQLVTDWLRDNK